MVANDRAGILVLDFVCSLASRCWSCVVFFLKNYMCFFCASWMALESTQSHLPPRSTKFVARAVAFLSAYGGFFLFHYKRKCVKTLLFWTWFHLNHPLGWNLRKYWHFEKEKIIWHVNRIRTYNYWFKHAVKIALNHYKEINSFLMRVEASLLIAAHVASSNLKITSTFL